MRWVPGRACGEGERSAEVRRSQEMSREHIFELGRTEGSVRVCMHVSGNTTKRGLDGIGVAADRADVMAD